jgi:hypothetical protein
VEGCRATGITLTNLSLSSRSFFPSSGRAFAVIVDVGLAMPIISSCSRFCFCSAVSCQVELSVAPVLDDFAPLPVLKPLGLGFVGSILDASPSAVGAIVIHSSLCSFGCSALTSVPLWSLLAADVCDKGSPSSSDTCIRSSDWLSQVVCRS